MGYRRFQIDFVFVEFDLFNATTFIQNCIFMNFRINLTQFYINFSKQEHQIELSLVAISFQPIPPLIFPLQSLQFF